MSFMLKPSIFWNEVAHLKHEGEGPLPKKIFVFLDLLASGRVSSDRPYAPHPLVSQLNVTWCLFRYISHGKALTQANLLEE